MSTAVAASCLLLGTAAGAGASVRPLGSLSPAASVRASVDTPINPVDGRLRGQNWTANVTQVSWPSEVDFGGRDEAPTGHRYVEFTLKMAENVNNTASGQPFVAASLEWDGVSHPLSISAINNSIGEGGLDSSWPTGSQNFIVAVANNTHDVDLVLTDGTTTQGFDLWTLRRTASATTVLYRDANSADVTDPTPVNTNLMLTNTSNGFTGLALLSLGSVTLSDFAPTGVSQTLSSPDQAFLNVVIDSAYPYDDANGLDADYNYLGSQSPMPGNLVTFTPSGGAAVQGIVTPDDGSEAGIQHDDGLFDCTYSFIVPGDLTSGTITVGPGSFTGAETFGFQETDNYTLSIASAATLAVTFPSVPAVAVQKKPPWVGQPNPPTSAQVSLASGSNGHGNADPSGGGGFPIWLAVGILAALAAGVVVFQRRRQASVAAVTTEPASGIPTTWPPIRSAESPATESVADTASEPEPAHPEALRVNVLGSVEVFGWRQTPDRRITEELLCFLTHHDKRPMSGDQIQLALRPTDGERPELTRKSFHSYMSTLRQCIGAEHLPDASNAKGYLIWGVESDWATFQELNRQAETAPPDQSIELRVTAMALLRGIPFAGVPEGHYGWVFDEGIHTDITNSIVRCATGLAKDLYRNGDFARAEEVARSGLRSVPGEYGLLEIGAWAIHRQAIDGRRKEAMVRRFLTDIGRALSPEDIERIIDSLPSHSDTEEG